MNKKNVVMLVFGVMVSATLLAETGVAANAATSEIGLDTYAKIAGVIITAFAMILGLPILRLNYRKMRAEIEKIELETRKLKDASLESNVSATENPVSSVQKIDAQNSSEANSTGLLNPGMLLYDFIFVLVILIIAERFFDVLIFDIFFSDLALLILSVHLLLPICERILKLRIISSPTRTHAENDEYISKLRFSLKIVYLLTAVSAIGFAVVLGYFEAGNKNIIYFAGGSFIFGLLMIAFAPYSNRKFEKYISDLIS